MDVNGKTVMITGCLQGIGRSTMDLFATGANVVHAYKKPKNSCSI